MSEAFRNILVAADRYRAGAHTNRHAIALAEKLRASLRMIYVVDLEELRVLALPPPSGGTAKHYVRGSAKEKHLVSEGHLESECRECSEKARA